MVCFRDTDAAPSSQMRQGGGQSGSDPRESFLIFGADICLNSSPTGQAVVTLQLRVLHRPLLLVRQRAGPADGRQEGRRGVGARVRVPQNPAQPLDLQQSAVVFPDGLPVLLILVALRALALEVQRAPDHVRRLVVGRLLQHRPTMMPLLLELVLKLLLVPGVFGPAAAAAVVGGLRARLEPRRAAAAAAVRPAFQPGFDHARVRHGSVKSALTPA